ncbi:hypothetical protein ACWFMI_00820 [Nocardiopsis terrae]
MRSEWSGDPVWFIPATLARDPAEFDRFGYQLASFRPFLRALTESSP